MPVYSEKLDTALQNLRSGEFQNALQISVELKRNFPNEFWPLFIETVSSAFLGNLSEFQKNIEIMKKMDEQNPYLRYLLGFKHLLANDIEKALWEYTQLSNIDDKWLAVDILEKLRTGQDITHEAQSKGISAFIALPTHIPDTYHKKTDKRLTHTNLYLSSEKIQHRYLDTADDVPPTKNTSKKDPLWKNRKIIFAVITGMAITGFVVSYYFFFSFKDKKQRWEDFSIKDQATVFPRESGNAKFLYDSRDELVGDFELAKKKLHGGYVNQARFLLQRITISNADFVSREKARIFLDFIPEPSLSEFRDNFPLSEIIKNPVSRLNSIILIEGKILQSKKMESGNSFRVSAEENGETYLIEVFSIISPVADPEKKMRIYGRYKSLLTKDKIIYLEAIKIIPLS